MNVFLNHHKYLFCWWKAVGAITCFACLWLACSLQYVQRQLFGKQMVRQARPPQNSLVSWLWQVTTPPVMAKQQLFHWFCKFIHYQSRNQHMNVDECNYL